MFKKKIIFLILFFNYDSYNAQNFELLKSYENTIEFKHSLVVNDYGVISIGNLQYISFSKSNKITTKNIGEPELPMFSESILIPNKGATTISINHDGYIEYTNVLISPSKGSLKRNVNPADVPFTFGEVYNQNSFYPGILAQDHEPFNIRNTRGLAVTVYPYQYNPVTKVLRVYQNIRVRVNTNPAISGLNEVDGNTVDKNEFCQVYEHTYMNYSTIEKQYTQLKETGEMLIISPTSFTSLIQPLADWKNQKGIKTTIVTTETTGAKATNIKAYIQNYYTSNPNLIYILLVGDHADIPAYSYGSNGSDVLWSDTYYAQLAGGSNDIHLDAFIGRFSGNASQITTMVNRTLEYEKSPAAGNWMTKAIGIGSGLGAGNGDDGEADWQHERNLRIKLMTYGYTEVAELYDGSHNGADAPGNPTASNVVTALNGGASLMNYTGHGDIDLIVSTNFTSSNINTATNNGFYPFVVSVACNNGQFIAGDCISENWLRNSNGAGPKGAIASVGSSIQMAWAEPMQTQDEIVDILTEQYPSNTKKTIGGLFYNSQISMIDQYNNSSAKEVMKTWLFFGDPSTMFRNQLTQTISASHVSSTSMGTTSIVVSCAVEGALICISQNNIILGTAIVSGGSVTITFPSINNSAPLLVTATQQNHGIYQGNISINNSSNELNELSDHLMKIYPNPNNGEFVIDYNLTNDANFKLKIENQIGQVILTENVSNTFNASIKNINLSKYGKGLFYISIESNSSKQIEKIVIE
jgi:gingipain R